ncbi:MAG TPA: DUF6152 family protein [Sphingomonadaceae bacterium]|nr:DUF6152 family protein [Sphingomonadaceae bacterium]
MSKNPSRNRAVALAALALGGTLAFAAPLAAHHSTAMFEWGKEVALKDAVVEKWEWTNPHTFLYVMVKDENGVVRRYALEGMSPNHLVRYGWGKRSVAPGDKVDLTYYPLRDGRRGGFNVTISKADGTRLNQFGEAGSRQ